MLESRRGASVNPHHEKVVSLWQALLVTVDLQRSYHNMHVVLMEPELKLVMRDLDVAEKKHIPKV